MRNAAAGALIGMAFWPLVFPWLVGLGSLENWYGKYVVWVLRALHEGKVF